MESFRCIHASRLLLDHQLHVSADFDPAVQKTVEEATLTAFERVIDEALVREVDCLLISGDCFGPDDRGLRGPAALARGMEKLADRDTQVIVHSPPRLWSSWPAGLRWPLNAHRLGTGFESRVSITREGKLLATISADSVEDRHAGWQIHLADSSGAGRTVHLTDDPLPVQGIRAVETGPHGCTFVEIAPDHEPQPKFLPVAPIRWERYSVAVSAATSCDDLLQELASQLEQTPRCAGELVRLVSWEISGRGQLFDRLADREDRDELLDELALLDPVPGIAIQTHAVALHPADELPQAVAAADDPAADFALRLEQRFARSEATVRECLAGSAFRGGPWEVKIESLCGELDAGELAHDARRLAMHWFAPTEESEEELSS